MTNKMENQVVKGFTDIQGSRKVTNPHSHYYCVFKEQQKEFF